MMRNLAALLCGFIFGCGLTISNMIDANKVLNFLDITGNWDPSLALVMLSALIVTTIGYRLVMRRASPQFATSFSLPQKTSIDGKLVWGAVIFGIGWGISGYCPGPSISALGLGVADPFYFMGGLIVGQLVYRK